MTEIISDPAFLSKGELCRNLEYSKRIARCEMAAYQYLRPIVWNLE